MSSTASAKDPRPLPPSDLKQTLEQQVAAGFTPELALELVLNEIVVRAADATHATGAAIAFMRDDEMVVRAATGFHAPDLGVPVDTIDGVTGACVRSREPQFSADTESDPRVDLDLARRLGVRSMVVVPVFSLAKSAKVANFEPGIIGLLQVFSPLASAFTPLSQTVLERFAREAGELRHASIDLREHVTSPIDGLERTSPVATMPSLEILVPDSRLDHSSEAFVRPRKSRASRYEGWTIALATLVFLAAIGMGFLIEARTGWLRSPSSQPLITAPAVSPEKTPQEVLATQPVASVPAKRAEKAKHITRLQAEEPTGSPDDLVVYDKDRVVFRIKPNHRGGNHTGQGPLQAAQEPTPSNRAVGNVGSTVVAAASKAHIPLPSVVWLAPEEAQTRLLNRVEPQYPPDALAAHRSGDVVLEVDVTEDGTVSFVRTLSGDPLLAAAATDAVRNWRYKPYRPHEQPTAFQTDVTLTFALPN